MYIVNAWFLYQFYITFQVLSSHIKISEIWLSRFFPDLGPVQYVKYHCHVTPVHFEKWPNSDFWSFAHSLWSETSEFKVIQGVRSFEKIPWYNMSNTIVTWPPSTLKSDPTRFFDPLCMVFGLKLPNLRLPKVLDCLRKFPVYENKWVKYFFKQLK